MIELQLKNYEIERGFNLFHRLTELMRGQINASTHYKLVGLRNSLVSQANRYKETKPKLIEDHVEKGEDGTPKTKATAAGTAYVFKSKKDEEAFDDISTKIVSVAVDEEDLLNMHDLNQFEADLIERQILMKFTKRFAKTNEETNPNEEE